jgi:hypothetical protein
MFVNYSNKSKLIDEEFVTKLNLDAECLIPFSSICGREGAGDWNARYKSKYCKGMYSKQYL